MPGRERPRPRPKPRAPWLPRELYTELESTAHRGQGETVRSLVARAIRSFEREDFAEALGPVLRAKTLAPRAATIRELLGLVHYRLGRWRDASRELAAYRRLSGRHDQDPILADCERALGRPGRAVEIVDELDPAEVGEETWVEGLVVGAGALGELGRSADAVRLLERGPVRPEVVLPYQLRLWYALAEALEKAGRRSHARDWWDLIYAEDPEFFDVATRRLR